MHAGLFNAEKEGVEGRGGGRTQKEDSNKAN